MAFVLDNSVSASWILADEFDQYAGQVLDAMLFEPAVVPGIWILEIANVLLVGCRRKRIPAAKRSSVLELIRSLPITVEYSYGQTDLERLIQLAEKYDLSAYDAAYLDLAIRLDLPLASKDDALRRAAKLASVPLLKLK